MSSHVSIHELHQHTAEVLRRVEAGERVRITRGDDEQPIAELTPPDYLAPADDSRPRTWVPGEVLLEIPLADPAMRDDIAAVYDRLDER